MTRKDYKLIADAIKHSSSMEELVDNLCVVLKNDNASFKPDKFREACKNGE